MPWTMRSAPNPRSEPDAVPRDIPALDGLRRCRPTRTPPLRASSSEAAPDLGSSMTTSPGSARTTTRRSPAWSRDEPASSSRRPLPPCGPGAPGPLPGGGCLPRSLNTVGKHERAPRDGPGAGAEAKSPVINSCLRGIWPRGRTKEDDRTHRISAAPARLTAQTPNSGPGPAPGRRAAATAGLCGAAGLDREHPSPPVAGRKPPDPDGRAAVPARRGGRFVLASVLPAWQRPLAGLLAAGYTASTPAALIISLSVGLFDFREPLPASFAAE